MTTNSSTMWQQHQYPMKERRENANAIVVGFNGNRRVDSGVVSTFGYGNGIGGGGGGLDMDGND